MEKRSARVFALAPMCGLIRGLTLWLLCLPLVIAVPGLAARGAISGLLLGVVAGLAALYCGVWLWSRPSRFVLDGAGLTIDWPVRRRTIPWSELRSARALGGRAELRAELGWGGRIGVGGLWGAFGWLWSSRRGLLDLYISRTDGLVLVERARRPLILSPERPSEFIESLQRGVARA